MAVTALLDVNALIVLAWPNHLHHHAVRSWFKLQKRAGRATRPLTEAGFVRVSCNPSAVHHSVTPRDAIALLERLTRLERHLFWPLEQSIVSHRSRDRRPYSGLPSRYRCSAVVDRDAAH